ncbi:hypothetical protein SGPA1_12407 [Streptomyces misionensis JCM 4497]
MPPRAPRLGGPAARVHDQPPDETDGRRDPDEARRRRRRQRVSSPVGCRSVDRTPVAITAAPATGLPTTHADLEGRAREHENAQPFPSRRRRDPRLTAIAGRSPDHPLYRRVPETGTGCRWGALDSESDEQPL